MDPNDWLATIRAEYLHTFIREGGAAIKFLVPANEDGRQALREGLRAAADEGGYQFALVDAATTRLHLVDRLFHEIARQVDWDTLAYDYLVRVLAAQGLRLPPSRETFSLTAIAALNEHPEPLLRTEVKRSLESQLFRDYAMAQEFRLAMIQLCRAQLDPGDDPELQAAVKAWLVGELRLLSGVKRALIFQRVARHNARHLLTSLCHWLRLAGRSGFVLALDIARYADTARPAARASNLLYYSTAATMDAYEVLRQLVDGTDELEGCFAAVLADPEFLHDDRRGLRSYQALYFRIVDDVRDRYRQNPLAPLVRIVVGGRPVRGGEQGVLASGVESGW